MFLYNETLKTYKKTACDFINSVMFFEIQGREKNKKKKLYSRVKNENKVVFINVK